MTDTTKVELVPEDMAGIVKAAFFAKGTKGNRGLPILVEDEPGTVKTSTFAKFAQQYGVPYLALSPGLHGEGTFGTIPFPDPTDPKFITFLAPIFAKTFLNGDGSPRDGLILIDEVKTTGPGLQPVLLGIIDERKIGFHYFGAPVRVFGASNSAEDSPNGSELASSVANRFGQVKWKAPDEDEWCRWMLRGAPHWDREPLIKSAAEVNEDVDAAWPAAWAGVNAIATSFISRSKSVGGKLHSRTKEMRGTPADSQPWGSRRTWEMAVRAWTSARIFGLSDNDTRIFVGGFIGQGLTQELFQFAATDDIPSAEELLTGAKQWDVRRLDLTMIVGRSMAAYLGDPKVPDRGQKIQRFWKLMEVPALECPDAIIDAVDLAITNRLMLSPYSSAVMKHLEPMLKALGHAV